MQKCQLLNTKLQSWALRNNKNKKKKRINGMDQRSSFSEGRQDKDAVFNQQNN